MTSKRLLPILALTASTALLLSGCAGLMDQFQNESTKEFESATDLVGNWEKSAPWLPDDASAIQTHESTVGADAILLAASSSELDPEHCSEIERQSAPVFEEDWSPDPFVDLVYACGDWNVIATETGWFGWTPNDPDERTEVLGE